MGELQIRMITSPYGDGSFIKTNGKSEQTYVITTGVWRLLVGDKPVIGLDLRNTGGAYARPGILPDLGVKGKVRLEVGTKRSKKYLEDFTKITTILLAGEPKWICEDNNLKCESYSDSSCFSGRLWMCLYSTGRIGE